MTKLCPRCRRELKNPEVSLRDNKTRICHGCREVEDLASNKEKNIFLKIIKKRIREFKNNVIKYKVRKQISHDLNIWLNKLDAALKDTFSAWYDHTLKGKPIPKKLKIPDPPKSYFSLTIENKFRNQPCEVCGDERVLNIAHVIPRWRGGVDEEWNLMRLCANHHHLFDEAKLTKQEWDAINWQSKDERARQYALKKRLARHQRYWKANQ
jgi:5-methylcytosine-specific restriction endonuclease McrA